MEIVPWTKVGEQTKLAGKFGKWLVSQNFLNPTTQEEEEFILFGQRDWSVILPITKGGMVVTVLQYKQGCNQIVRELPAGTADTSDEETPEDVARRELLEETGYLAGRIVPLGPPQFISTRSSTTRFFPFLALGCRKVAEAKLDASEEIETELVSFEEWVQLCHDTIVEPSAIVATFRAQQALAAWI